MQNQTNKKWWVVVLVLVVLIGMIVILLKNQFSSPSFSGLVDVQKSSDYYFGPNGGIYYYIPWNEAGSGVDKQLDGADVKSFQVLSQSFARDGSHVYYKGLVSTNTTVAVLDSLDIATLSVNDDGIIKDKNNVYVWGIKIDGADPSTFAVLKDKYDNEMPYYFDKLYSNRNTSWFLRTDYSSTGGKAYTANSFKEPKYSVTKMIIDRSTFVANSNWLAHDKNNIYFFGNIIPGASSKGFNNLGYDYLKTDDEVYYMGDATHDSVYNLDDEAVMPVKLSADPSNFQVLPGKEIKVNMRTNYLCSNDTFAKDSNNVYYKGSIVEGADSKTFVNINGGYGADANHVFLGSKMVQGVNPNSFVVKSCAL